jgi:type IX secretion system PorP/SprF family membrane protein
MNRRIKYFLLVIASVTVGSNVNGQQQATFAQYMFNGLAINPAYAGSHDALSVSFLARFQNVGLSGAPNTQTLSIHSPIANERFAVGFLAIHDQIGVISQTGVNAMYAYRLPLGKGGILSMGVQLGVSSYRANYTQLSLYQNDAAFASDVRQDRLNIGAGLYLTKPLWYVGISMPHMMNNVFDRGNSLETIYQNIPVLLTGGYVFTLSRMLKVKPNFLFKAVDSRIVELDLNANFLFDDVVWVGVSYKFTNTITMLTELQVTDQLRFGYAYSMATGPIRQAEVGSHEMLVQYRFKFNMKGVVSPRFF